MASIIYLIEEFKATKSDTINSKTKNFSQYFLAFLKSILNFKHLPKKMTVISDVFPENWLQKKWLDKGLKGPVSEDSQKNNMANGSKLCWNLNGSTSKIFINHFKGSIIEKSLF